MKRSCETIPAYGLFGTRRGTLSSGSGGRNATANAENGKLNGLILLPAELNERRRKPKRTKLRRIDSTNDCINFYPEARKLFSTLFAEFITNISQKRSNTR